MTTYVLNVKDFGALGNGTVNDTAAIQAAFDTAFGSSASPHGTALKFSNRPVYFPTGSYLVNSTLNLTRVVGGYIFGDGAQTSKIVWGGASNQTLLNINGMAGSRIERLYLANVTGATAKCINYDWDNAAGGGGLRDNVLSEILFEGGGTGVHVAASGNGGQSTLLYQCTATTFQVAAVLVSGADANVTCLLTGGSSNARNCKVTAGMVQIIGPSNGTTVAGSYDYEFSTLLPCSITGGRSEGANMLMISQGSVTISGFTHAAGSTNFLNITGGQVIVDGCHVLDQGRIVGTGGNLYLRGNNWNRNGTGQEPPPGDTAAYIAAGGTVVQDIGKAFHG
jgi:hypothetical protein